MVRNLALVLAALVCTSAAATQPAKDEIVTKVEGKLTNDDPRDKVRMAPCKVHTVNMKMGNVYTIDMASRQFDSYLRLEDKDGKQLDEDDDSGGNLDARIVFNCMKDGEYKIICTALIDNMGGQYTLTVKKSTGNVKTNTAHDALLGKPAPDFQGDFTLNGKALGLSDFKDKVVLVQFFDPRSDACIATIARLGKWSKEMKSAGLEVVSVTFYCHEIGQMLAFDKETGRLSKVEKANKKSEQAALKEFAAYHKMGHQLLVLPKEDAMSAYDAYAVNGVPLAVLIDRKGVIRAMRFDDEKTAGGLEREVKKVLDQK